MATLRHTPYFEVRDALGEGGCAICTLVSRSLTRYIGGLLYESVNSPPTRQRLRDSLGLCAIHNELVREARSASGAAIIQRDLLKTLAARLANSEQSASSGWLEDLFRPPKANRGDALAPEQPCPACVVAEERERDYMDVLLASLEDGEMLAALRASAGLCAPHLRTAMSRARGDQMERLKAEQLVIWQRLIAELDEFIRKLDYRFTHEGMGAEGDAWDRALDLVAGKARVMGARNR